MADAVKRGNVEATAWGRVHTYKEGVSGKAGSREGGLDDSRISAARRATATGAELVYQPEVVKRMVREQGQKFSKLHPFSIAGVERLRTLGGLEVVPPPTDEGAAAWAREVFSEERISTWRCGR